MHISWRTLRKARTYLVCLVVFLHFFVTPQINLAYAATAEASLQLAIAAPAPSAEAVAPSAGVPGAAFPGLTVFPNTESVIFTPGELGISPYVVVLEVSGTRVFPGETPRTYSREPEFLGKTNLRDAVVYLQYDHLPSFVYTTFADSVGRWRWSSLVNLQPGWHTLHITAISPYNPYFTTYTAFQFYIAEIPQGIETPQVPAEGEVAAPQPPIPPKVAPVIPPQVMYETPLVAPFEPARRRGEPDRPGGELGETRPPLVSQPLVLDGKKDSFGVRVEVSPETKTIRPGERIKIESKIIPIPPQSPRDLKERRALVKIRVYDEKGVLVFEKEEEYDAREKISLEKVFLTSPILEPGVYRVRIEAEKDGISYISQDTFVVEQHELITPRAVIESIKFIKDELKEASGIGIIFAIGFFILFLRERALARRQTRVRDEELERGGFIR